MPLTVRRAWRALVAVWVALAGTTASLEAQPELAPRQAGDSWVAEQVGTVPAGTALEILSSGPVAVRGMDRAELRYAVDVRIRADGDEAWARARLGAVGVRVERRTDGTVVLSLRKPACQGCRFHAHLEVETPAETRATAVLTSRGGVEVRGLQGSVRIQAAAGPIEVDSIGGDLEARAEGGRVWIGTVGGTVRGHTAAGSIQLQSAQGSADLKTELGNIEVDFVGGDLHAATSGGRIRAKSVGGDLRATTGSGSIRLGSVRGGIRAAAGAGSITAAAAVQGLRAETAAGEIEVRDAGGTLRATAGTGDIRASLAAEPGLLDSALETSVGSIIVQVPESLPLTIDARVSLAKGTGGIVSDFPAIAVHQRPANSFGPRSVEAWGDLNGGGAILRIRSGVGHIEIRRQR